MSTQYEGDPLAFPFDYTIPDDGEPITTAAVVNVALEALGDRTAYLFSEAEVDAGNLSNLLTLGFAAGWPKITMGNPQRTHTEWCPFAFTDATHPALVPVPGSENAWREGFTGFTTGEGLGTVLGGGTNYYIYCPIKKLRNGALLKKVRLYFTPTAGHAGLPGVLPKVNVLRQGVGGLPEAIGPEVTVSDPEIAGTVAVWNSWVGATPPPYVEFFPTAGALETCSDERGYWIRIQDENGMNALPGNRYWGAFLTWEISEVQP